MEGKASLLGVWAIESILVSYGIRSAIVLLYVLFRACAYVSTVLCTTVYGALYADLGGSLWSRYVWAYPGVKVSVLGWPWTATERVEGCVHRLVGESSLTCANSRIGFWSESGKTLCASVVLLLSAVYRGELVTLEALACGNSLQLSLLVVCLYNWLGAGSLVLYLRLLVGTSVRLVGKRTKVPLGSWRHLRELSWSLWLPGT